MEKRIGNTRLILILGDITDQDTEAIVNAANPTLLGGGGVDGTIHRRGGPEILEECRMIRKKEWPNGLPTGKAVITGGGKLKAKYVIHTVGPVWKGGNQNEPELLANAYMNSLSLASKKNISTIAFPSISTGAYGYPVEKASRIALKSVKDYIEKYQAKAEKDQGIKEVRFVLHSSVDIKIYKESMEEICGKC